MMVLRGIEQGSGVHADFERPGVSVLFNANRSSEEGIVLAFRTRAEAAEWHRIRQARKDTIGKECNTEPGVESLVC